VAKKWYSFFVVTDEQDGAPTTDQSGPAAAPRAADLVPDGESSAPPAAAGAATAPVDLSAVYEAAKIATAAHGYTALKVADMLDSEHIRALPIDVKRKSIMVALDAAGVKVTEIVEDAVRRDRALDTYERVLEKRLDDLRARTAASNQQLEEEIAQRVAELRGRIDANNRAVALEQSELQAWQQRKRQEEARIADAVSPFVSEQPITTARPAAHKGDADAR
jgi:hypothetical protein